jgi:hypothetical protein
MCPNATNKVMPRLKETVFWLGTAILVAGIIISSYGLALYALAWSRIPDLEQSPEPEDAVYGRSMQSLGVGVFLTGTIVALFTKLRESRARNSLL